MAFWKKNDQEFKPDVNPSTWVKTLRMTRLQQLRLLKWGGYILSIILALVIQDVALSQVRIFGATAEIVVCTLLLITILEGTEVGSLFILISSLCYFYSGTAPGAYSIGLLTFLGIGVTMFRQMYMRRNKASLILCAGVAAVAYEIGIFGFGLFEGLTYWGRLPMFLIAGGYNVLLMIPLYPLIEKIGLIGGNTWKE